MDQGILWVMEVVGPALLLIILVWLVMRTRSSADAKRSDATAERGTRDVYREEEVRRREGTDDL